MRKTPKQFYYPGLAIQQEISACQLPDLKGAGHLSWEWSHMGPCSSISKFVIEYLSKKSLWKVKFDTIKANHIQM